MNLQTHFRLTSLLLLILAIIPGCQAIADIFKAGVWVGIILVVVVVGVILMIARAFKK